MVKANGSTGLIKSPPITACKRWTFRLITVAVTQALYATSELRTHIGRALDENGVTPQELSEVILHVTFYVGWPKAVNAGRLASEAFEARGVSFADLE